MSAAELAQLVEDIRKLHIEAKLELAVEFRRARRRELAIKVLSMALDEMRLEHALETP